MRSIRVLASALLTVGCTVPMAAPTRPVTRSAAPATSDAYAASVGRIFDLINVERRRRGLRPLVFNAQLDQMARIQATNMAYFQKMAHVIPQAQLPGLSDRARSVGYPYAEIAENVALGYPSPEAVVQGWMNSSGHRANILNPGVVETGISIARSSAGGLYYCQVFGRRLSSI
ncbi:MAG TPA: CAP domain-containing protein [Gemmatimonadaceae bacterium]|nr:CAP domain-containing protein [Gemmatimonadaceae bacterium]